MEENLKKLKNLLRGNKNAAEFIDIFNNMINYISQLELDNFELTKELSEYKNNDIIKEKLKEAIIKQHSNKKLSVSQIIALEHIAEIKANELC